MPLLKPLIPCRPSPYDAIGFFTFTNAGFFNLEG